MRRKVCIKIVVQFPILFHVSSEYFDNISKLFLNLKFFNSDFHLIIDFRFLPVCAKMSHNVSRLAEVANFVTDYFRLR